MKYHFFSSIIVFILLFPVFGSGQKVLQWRGVNRSGVYDETSLLKSWPEKGPELLWEFNGLGNGYGSPVITGEMLFINGEIDTVSYLFALDL